MQGKDQSHCEFTSVAGVRDAYHTYRLVTESQKYYGITSLYNLPTYFYLRLGMGGATIYQHIFQKHHQYSKIHDYYVRYYGFLKKKKQQHIGDLANLFKAMIKFGLKISLHKCQFFRDQLTYITLIFLLKDGKSSYTIIRERCNAIIELRHQNELKAAYHFAVWSTFCHHNLNTLEGILYQFTRYRKKIIQCMEEYQRTLEHINKLLISSLGIMHANGKW